MNLPRDIEIRLDKADKASAKAKTDTDRQRALEARKSALDELSKREADHWTAKAMIERDRLERLRDGGLVVEELVTTVPVTKDGNPVWKRGRLVMKQERVKRSRITNSDGLETLLQAGTITAKQFAHGMTYRTLYEAADHGHGLTPPQIGAARGGAKRQPINDAGQVDQSAVQRIIDEARHVIDLMETERDVLALCGAEPLTTLRLVAGEGRTIFSLTGRGGRRRAINLTKGLLRALDAMGATESV